MTRRPRVALVYPPFGSAALPSLGLALLAAELKEQGFRCRILYWNLDLLDALPLPTMAERFAAYRTLAEATWYPFNEWIFGRVLHGSAIAERDQHTLLELLDRAALLPHEPLSADVFLALRDQAGSLVDKMVERLSGADVVGISTTFFQNIPALALARRLKARYPETLVVLGGANCDGEMGPALLELFPFIDGVITGEANGALSSYVGHLTRGTAPATVAGLTWRDRSGAIHAGPPARPVEDLNSLPYPDYSDWVAERRRVGLDHVAPLVLALESSRGCWWGERRHCTFCGLNANGMAYRSKDPSRFIAEVEAVVQSYESRFIFMTDNILSRQYFDTFIAWARTADLKVDFFYEIKANTNREEVRQLAEAGVTAVQPGVESFSSEALRLMRKGSTGIQNVAFLKNAQQYGIKATYNLLVGFPEEDPGWYDDVAKVLPRLAHLRPPTAVPTVEFHRFSPFHADPEAFHLKLQPHEAYEALYPLGVDDLTRIAYRFRRPDAAAEPPAYVRELRHRAFEWKSAFEEVGARLEMWTEGEELVIDDSRPAFGPRRIRLYGFAAELYQLLADPQPLRTLLAAAAQTQSGATFGPDDLAVAMALRPGEVALGFDADTFAEEPQAALSLLADTGLLYEEKRGGSAVAWLALALPAEHAPTPTRWAATGV